MEIFCGLCGSHEDEADVEAGERQPLLAQYGDETERQRLLHEKLHSYQMLRALAQGYMPSSVQTIANLRTLLATDVLAAGHPAHRELSPSGRSLVRFARRWLEQFIALIQHKNGEDQIQDFVWCLLHARVSVDVDKLARAAGQTQAQTTAHTKAAYQSLQTVGSLLLTNSEFRLFLTDLTAVGRDVFRDTAFALSDASKEAAENVAQSSEEGNKNAGGDGGEQPKTAQSGEGEEGGAAPSGDNAADNALPQAQDNLAAVAGEATAAAGKVAAEAKQSVASKLVDNDDGARDQLLGRLKKAVLRLRQRPDYSESVSLLTMLLQRYAGAYVHAAEDAVDAVAEEVREEETVHTNDDADAALRNFWSFLTSFGDRAAWEELERRFKRLLDRSKGDGDTKQDFDVFINSAGSTLQDLLTDPEFFDHADERLDALKKQAVDLDEKRKKQPPPEASSSEKPEKEQEKREEPETTLRDDVRALLDQVKTTLHSVATDKDVSDLLGTSGRIADLLWPSGQYANSELLGDAVNVFVPLLVQAVQHVPIPRLEVASPDVDLLLENLVLEPGRTVNHSSFLPYRLHVQVRNDVDVRKARLGNTVASQLETSATIRINGLSLAADEIGYVLRLHSGPLLRFDDAGVASFRLDERGLDLELDVAAVRGAAETVLTLKQVRVRIHRFDYELRRSKVSWLTWLFKPLLRPLLRKTLERQIGLGVAEALRTANRELVFARERLRAARIASAPHRELPAFFRAIAARYAERDVDASVWAGFFNKPPKDSVFRGVYAPGSLLKVWEDEAAQARDRIEDYERGGWRNAVFDVPTEHGQVNGE